jgi:hypothetical protein
MRPHLRLLLIVSVTLAVSAVMVRLGWELAYAAAVGTMVIVALLMLTTLGVYALCLYFSIRPNVKKLNSPPVRKVLIVIITAAFISGIIHYYRFIPSPEATPTLSKVIATLLLLASISGYLLVLGYFWSLRKPRE